MTKAKQIFLCGICAAVLILLTAFSAIPRPAVISYAANTDISFDDTYVMDDLQNSVIDGKDYSKEENNLFADFRFDAKKETQLFSLVEYCYSFYENLQGNYGLYVYVYNPKGIRFAADSSLNKISMRVGTDTSAEYVKYSLLYLNRCTETNYEGLFYKYKIILPPAERQRILETLNSTERAYSVSELELQTQGAGAESYYVATNYLYSGYAAGYGANADADSTLTIQSEQCDTLPLSVHPTFFRPKASNGKNKYTQDTLHSVYFAVPNKYIKQYGEMVAVHATWLNAVTKWGLLTGHKESYDIIRNNLIGKAPSQSVLSSMFVSGEQGKTIWEYITGNDYITDFEMLRNGLTCRHVYNRQQIDPKYIQSTIDALHWVFYSGAGDNSADSYVIPSSELTDWMRSYTQEFGGDLVVGEYSKSLFESVDDEFTEVNWDYKKDFSISTCELSQTFWESLTGKHHFVDKPMFNGIKAIHKVTAEDFKATPEDTCNGLYMFQADYTNASGTGLYDLYQQANDTDSTVYLFRYRVSDYVSEEAERYTEANVLGKMKYRDSNNYFFKQSVDLDFDIIDVTFSNGEKNTVIPVAMSPIDIVHSATPPLDTTTDSPKKDWVKIVLGVILLVLLLVLLQITGILPLIVKGIAWIITAPFKALASLLRRKEE